MLNKLVFVATLLCSSLALAHHGHEEHHGDHDGDDCDHKVEVCHNNHEINIDQHAVDAHLAHGDCLGDCPCEPVVVPECCNDSDCDDELFCNGQESCDNGNCVAGTNPCNDNEVCLEDTDECVCPLPPPQCVCDEDCDDGLFCNGQEQCVDGQCENAPPPCDTGTTCSENTNECNAVPPPECSCDNDCSDGLFCTGHEVCDNGQCVDGINPCANWTHCDETTRSCLVPSSEGEGEGEGEGEHPTRHDDEAPDSQLEGSSFFTCDSTPPTGNAFLAAFAIGLSMISFRKRKIMPLVAIIGLFAVMPAYAEGVTSFQLAPTDTAFLTTQNAETMPNNQLHLQLSSVWDHDSLVFRDSSGIELSKALENTINTQFGVSIGVLDNFEFGGSFGAMMLQGPAVLNNAAFAVTDPTAYGKWKFVSVSPGIDAALKLQTDLPFGVLSTEPQTLSGDPLPTVTPSLLLTFANNNVKVGAEVGHTFRFAPKQLPDSNRLGQSLNLGLGAELTVVPKLLSVVGDVDSRLLYPLQVGQLGTSRLAVPVDANFGVKVLLSQFTVLAGVGTGVIPDFGSPDLRVFAGLSWTPDFSNKPKQSDEQMPCTKAPVVLQPTEHPLAVLDGDTIVILQPVHFAFDKDVVLKESLPVLDAVATILQNHKEISLVLIGGHTDSVGSLSYNDDLSTRRVASVRNYLLSVGIKADRLMSAGFGERMPLVPNTTPSNRAVNRRVEFKILARTK